MKTLVVIPARLGATRLPRKPLRLLGGQPLVIRVWERARSLAIADLCVIATDSEEIADAARPSGALVVLTSPTHDSGTERIAEVAARAEFAGYDVIVNVQGDEPFMSESALRGAIAQVKAGSDVGTAAATASPDILQIPTIVKVVLDDTGHAMYFSRAPIPFLREPADSPLLHRRVLQHVGVYAYTQQSLRRWIALPPHPLERIERLEQLRPLCAGLTIGVAVVDESPAPGIDTEDDLVRANHAWTAFSHMDS